MSGLHVGDKIKNRILRLVCQVVAQVESNYYLFIFPLESSRQSYLSFTFIALVALCSPYPTTSLTLGTKTNQKLLLWVGFFSPSTSLYVR